MNVWLKKLRIKNKNYACLKFQQLSLAPLSGAIAAGNCAVIKPSELAPKTAEVIARLIAKYLDPDCYAVVQGGIPETTELLSLKFDYIFYTGGAKVDIHLSYKNLTNIWITQSGVNISKLYSQDPTTKYTNFCVRIWFSY